MCLTGGFALALVADQAVLAPVVAQPSLPLIVHKAALGMCEVDVDAVRDRIARDPNYCVLGLRYKSDFVSPKARINSIIDLLGSKFEYIELPGHKHSTLTLHRHPQALERTISFLAQRLHSPAQISSV
jgi:hypothetical protein